MSVALLCWQRKNITWAAVGTGAANQALAATRPPLGPNWLPLHQSNPGLDGGACPLWAYSSAGEDEVAPNAKGASSNN